MSDASMGGNDRESTPAKESTQSSGVRPVDPIASHALSRRAAVLAVVVAALGYFVDIFDLLLFAIVRDDSLRDLGYLDPKVRSDLGLVLDNYIQMTGLMLGGLVWGVIGDRRGRLSVLFGSILCYSVANLLNAFVRDVPQDSGLSFLHSLGLGSALGQYQVLRFIAGFGLAGELGAGVTLVVELMGRERRGIGTTIVATVGVLGAVFAAVIAKYCDWRTSYLIGGALGLALLFLRVGVVESGMFNMVKSESISRGKLWQFVSSWDRFRRYLAVILIGVPIWFAVGVLTKNFPEIAIDLGMSEAHVITVREAVLWCYVGLAFGDLASGLLSQFLRSRRRALFFFHLLTGASIALLFAVVHVGEGIATELVARFEGTTVRFWCVFVSAASLFLLGVSIGYWAVFVTVGAEQFGTNLRATAATTAPNFVRWAGAAGGGFLWSTLKDGSFSSWQAAAITGAICLVIAVIACWSLRETFGTSLDYVER